MITITLKAKHYYFIVYYLRNNSIQEYFSLVQRMKTALSGNTDLEAEFSVSATPAEAINIFKVLTALSEGVANTVNVEMDDLLNAQIIAGATQEGIDGIGPDADGNLPDNAYWQILAKGILFIKGQNGEIRNGAIAAGQAIIDQI
jgi:hypothetical protein